MANYRKILVAYDGSASARNALSCACELSRKDKSWIKVLAVLPVYDGDLELIGVKNIKETITGPGRKLLAEAQEIADSEDAHILTDMEQGEPYKKIVDVADEENCDLIVMGRKGLNPLERELMGSVTARVIGYTTKNVLVVPENTKLAWGNILLATDGSEYSESAVSLALDLAKQHSAKLTAVSAVYTNDEFFALAPDTVTELVQQARSILEPIVQRATQKGIAINMFVKEGEPYQAITSLASDVAADIIVMGSCGRKGFNRLLMGSVTERVIGYAECPIMISH